MRLPCVHLIVVESMEHVQSSRPLEMRRVFVRLDMVALTVKLKLTIASLVVVEWENVPIRMIALEHRLTGIIAAVQRAGPPIYHANLQNITTVTISHARTGNVLLLSPLQKTVPSTSVPVIQVGIN